MRASFLAAGVVLMVVASLGSPVARTQAQDAETEDFAGHAMVGSWLVDTDIDNPMNPGALASFHDDGTFFESEGGIIAVGVWEPVDQQTAMATFLGQAPDEAGNLSTFKVRVTINLAADAKSFRAPYTLEAIAPDGTGSGEFGLATAVGTRITIEPQGAPLGPISDLLGAAGGAAGGESAGGETVGPLVAIDIGWMLDDVSTFALGDEITLTASPGDTIEIVSDAIIEHNFSIDALGIDVAVPPGETVEVTIPADAAPGEYEFYCKVPGHKEAGMAGTLVVE